MARLTSGAYRNIDRKGYSLGGCTALRLQDESRFDSWSSHKK